MKPLSSWIWRTAGGQVCGAEVMRRYGWYAFRTAVRRAFSYMGSGSAQRCYCCVLRLMSRSVCVRGQRRCVQELIAKKEPYF